MTGFNSKRQAAQDKMELADAYALTVAETPHMPTPLERRLSTERIERARNALEAALEQDKLNDDDDAQGYIAQYKAALSIEYQRGFSDGKRSAQREPLTEEQMQKIIKNSMIISIDFVGIINDIVAAHNIKEQP